MVAWSRQKYLKKEKITPLKEIVGIAQAIEDKRKRALFVLSYLTAGRCQELVRYKGYDMINGKKVFNGERRPSIKKSDLEIEERGGRKILVINLRNEKNKDRLRKEVPVPLDLKENIIFYNMLVPYLNTLGNYDELFPIGYNRAYEIITSLGKKWNPHWFRHLRLTHLVTIYKYREHQLMMYAGWSDSRPAKRYLEMNWEDLLY